MRVEDWLDDLATIGQYAAEKADKAIMSVPIPKSIVESPVVKGIGQVVKNPSPQEVGKLAEEGVKEIGRIAKYATTAPDDYQRMSKGLDPNSPEDVMKAARMGLSVDELNRISRNAEYAALNFSPGATIFKGYHGTNVPIKAFKREFLGSSTGARSAEKGFWFTDTPKVAESYATYAAEVAPVKKLLDKADEMEKLAHKTGDNKYWDLQDDYVRQAEELEMSLDRDRAAGQNVIPVEIDLSNPKVIDAKGKTFQEMSDFLNKSIDMAIKKGHDGIVLKNIDDAATFSNMPATHYMVFDPNKIRSSISKKILAENFLDQ